MQRFCKNLFLALLVVSLISCRSTIEQRYMADLADGEVMTGDVSLPNIPLSIGEDVAIDVYSCTPEAVAAINMHGRELYGTGQGEEQEELRYYRIDTSGCIVVPLLGLVKAAGLTVDSLSTLLSKLLVDGVVATDAKVSVSRKNTKVYVFGEVKKPGKCPFVSERMTIFDALAAVGDATIYALRSRVVVMRQQPEGELFFEVDLTSKTLFNSPGYYLYPNDVVYVYPNKYRVRQADYDEYIPQYLALGVSAIRVASLIRYVSSTRDYFLK